MKKTHFCAFPLFLNLFFVLTFLSCTIDSAFAGRTTLKKPRAEPVPILTPITLADATPPVISNIAVSSYGPNYVIVTWVTDDLSSSQVDYGTTKGYGGTTPLDMNLVTSHSVTIPELTWSTRYHFRVRSHNSALLVSESNDQHFDTASPRYSTARTSGRQLLVQKRKLDGTLSSEEPYIIRGVNWSPASINTNTTPWDSNNANVRREEFKLWYQMDIPLIAAMKVNTVRTFIDFGFDGRLGPIGLTILDEFYRRGIMVIMTVDDANNDLTRITAPVQYYQDHPAILMWSLGSEWNINGYFRGLWGPSGAQATETAAQLVKSFDTLRLPPYTTLHPVVSSYGNSLGNVYGDGLTPDFEMLDYFVNSICPTVDVWSLNEFRGRGFSYLFERWKFISEKPMFLGEYGIDTYDSRILGADEQTHAEWDLALWNEIARNLSANDPNSAALGGFVFEWNDEWWKVYPPGSQQDTGWVPLGFPDGYASEEFWGIVDINRVPRQAYYTLAQGFDPSFEPQPAPKTRTYTAISAGASAPVTNVAEFRENGVTFYMDRGFSLNGGRGINVAAIDPNTGHLVTQVRGFDTWAYVQASIDLVNHLDSLPNGTLILLAVADEGGITYWDSCTPSTNPADQLLISKLRELGSTQIDNYCYRDSWSMITVKGESAARSEQLGHAQVATAEETFTLP